MVENVLIFAVLATSMLSLILSYMPSIWGKVFMFASAVVAVIPATMLIVYSTSQETTIWLSISYLIVFTGFINSLRFKPETATI